MTMCKPRRVRVGLVSLLCAGSTYGCAGDGRTVAASAVHSAEPARGPEREPAPAPPSAPPSPGATPARRERALALHTVALEAASVYPSGEVTRILGPGCIAEVRDTSVAPGRYPLPGRACREPLKQLASSGGQEWLQAGPELWLLTAKERWRLAASLERPERVFLPSGRAGSGLVLVVPYRLQGWSAYQVSSSFEFRRSTGRGTGKLPVPAAAKADPSSAFDDFVSGCFTKTRLAEPKAFHVTADGRLLVFGTECDRDEQGLASVAESWRAGETKSTFERLPFPRPEPLLQVEVAGDTAIWAATASALIRFDGTTWHAVPLPEGISLLAAFSRSASGTLWLLTSHDQLWEQRPGQAWEARPSAPPVAGVHAIRADGDDDVWLSTDRALYSTRNIPTSTLCQSPCEEYWGETLRMSQVPRGD